MRRLLPVLILALAALPALGELPREGWKTARSISCADMSASQLVYLPLDEAALAEAETLSEYRLVRSDGVEIPYRMVEEGGQTETYALQAEILSQSLPGSEPEEIVVDTGDHPRARLRLALDLRGEDFRCRATVEGSSDRVHWRTLRSEARILRQTGVVEHTTFSLSPMAERYLRVRLFHVQGILPRIQAVTAASEVGIARHLLPIPATLSQREAPKEQRTEIVLDFGRQVRDVVEARLEIADPAFERSLKIEVTNQEKSPQGEGWVTTASRTLQRLASGGDIRVPLSIAAAKRLRLSFYNGDDRPLRVQQVSLWRMRRGLIFPAEAGQKYELWYGRPNTVAPVYDLERLPLSTPPAALVEVALGTARSLVTPPPPPPAPPWSERYPILFWGGLLTVLALLAILIIRSMRGIKRPLESR